MESVRCREERRALHLGQVGVAQASEIAPRARIQHEQTTCAARLLTIRAHRHRLLLETARCRGGIAERLAFGNARGAAATGAGGRRPRLRYGCCVITKLLAVTLLGPAMRIIPTRWAAVVFDCTE